MRKLLALLLVVAMVFGFIGTASAAPVFPDITGNAAEKDIVKLYTLGIIGGYPDGSFKPAGNITRGEFAKIVVLSLGKGGSANLLKNTASQFKDVPAGQWYTGFINVAVANGIIKGYADGTFKPEANISQAEAATMLLRAMGYNDNLPGAWPLNYVMKAADLGIISEGFAADGLASRAFVCAATMAMLGWEKVVYTATTNSFSEPHEDGALLAVLGGATVVGDETVLSYSSTNGTLTFTDEHTIKLAANVKVATGEALSDLANKHITYISRLNAGVVEIIYIEVKTPVVAGKVASVDAVNNTVTLTNGTVVKLASGCAITKNGSAATIIDVNGSDVTALLDGNGKAYKLVAYKLEIDGLLTGKQTVVASGVTTMKLTVDGHGEFTVPSTATIVRNGAVATFADLKVNDDIKMSANGTAAVYVDAFALTKEAVVTSFAMSAGGKILSVTFADGTTVGVKSDVPAFTVTVGMKTKFNLDRAGLIVAKLSESAVANKVTGKITAIGTTITSDGAASYVTLDSGVTYTLVSTATFTVNLDASVNTFDKLASGMYASLSLNSSGKVSAIAAYKNGKLTTDWDILVSDNLATGAVVTLNTVSTAIGSLGEPTEVYVTWDAANGELTKVEAFVYAEYGIDWTVIGTTMSTDGSSTVYSVDYWDEGAESYDLAKDFVVRKDGVIGTFDSIKLGDKFSIGPIGTTENKFLNVITDTTFAWYDDFDDDITFTAGETGFSYGLADIVKDIKIYVDGSATPLANPGLCSSCRDHGSISGLTEGTHVVGIVATDYAGNIATLSFTVTVVIPD